MPRGLLPGVRRTPNPPAVVCRTRDAIETARRRATLRDAGQLLLIVAVDYLFTRFPSTHLPALDRSDSLTVLGVMNVAIVAGIWLARVLPRWSARRVVSTWCLTERARFFAAARRK